MSTINKQLKAVLEEWQSLQLAEHHLKALQGRIQQAKDNIAQLEQIVSEEYRDIERLEKIGLPVLFRTILGNKKEQLEIERQEYLQAVLQWRDAEKDLELLSYEEEIIKEKLGGGKETKQKLDRLTALREEELKTIKGPIAINIRRINAEIDDKVKLRREIYEARMAGEKTSKMLLLILNMLNQAMVRINHWGVGLSSSQEKILTEQFKKIQQHIWTVRPLIAMFEDELQDVYDHQQLKLLPTFDKFGNAFNSLRFYKNLISDWIVRKRIYHAVHQIENVLDRTELTIQSLNNEESRIAAIMFKLEDKKRKLVKGSVG